MGSHRLDGLTWTEVGGRAAATVVAVPVGSTEQHGPHLPLSTDTDIAVALVERLAAVRADVLTGPALAYGSSGEHAAFAGTLSIGQVAVETVLVEIGRSADAFAGVLFVSGHGGNAGPLWRAVRRLENEGRRVRAWAPAGVPAGVGAEVRSRADAHAGFVETSVMLALAPGAVRRDAAVAGCRASLPEVMDRLSTCGVGAVSPNGVLGDPAGASAEVGAAILAGWAEELVTSLEGWP